MSRMYEMLQVQSINVLKVFRDRKRRGSLALADDQ